MRAFLSFGTRRWREDAYGPWSIRRGAWEAENEARAISTMHEPLAEGEHLSVDRLFGVVIANDFKSGNAHAAMYEALAAFVEA